MIFTVIYSLLIFLTSLFLEFAFSGQFGDLALYLVLIFMFASLILSLLYAWLLVSRNKRNWATFKCIGYTNGNVITMLAGIILFTAFLGFFVVVEILFHYAAIFSYVFPDNVAANNTLISLLPTVLTSVTFMLVQLISIALIYRKTLKIRPIVALKKVEA